MNPQDPLTQLQDIHLPAEIGLWPPAWGWWILIAIILVSVASTIFLVRRRKIRNAYRGTAIRELEKIFVQFDQEKNAQALNTQDVNAQYLQAVSIILRRTALSGFNKQFNASLKNEEWLIWLDAQCAKTQNGFSQGIGRVLLSGPYQKQPEIDRSALQALVILWVKEHRNQWQNKSNANKISEAAPDV